MAEVALPVTLIFLLVGTTGAVDTSDACATTEAPSHCQHGGWSAAEVVETVPRPAALLQVGQKNAKAHMEDFHGDESDDVSKDEIFRQTKPLQEQIDELKADIKALKEAQGLKTKKSSTSKKDAKPGDEGNTKKNDKDDSSKDGGGNGDSKRKAGGDEDKPKSDRRSDDDERPPPDWNGVAPAPSAWNGLHDVKAHDSGPRDSSKGIGVATGSKYTGDWPYEILMDVDYIVDSNPASDRTASNRTEFDGMSLAGLRNLAMELGVSESELASTLGREEIIQLILAARANGNSSGNRTRTAPKNGGKTAPARTRPKSGAKTQPSSETGGETERTSPKNGGKSGPAKRSPGLEGKSASDTTDSQTDAEDVSRRETRNGGKSAPVETREGSKTASRQEGKAASRQPRASGKSEPALMETQYGLRSHRG